MTKAAHELHVTPGAVSQQVKALEAFLGVKLLRRLNRTVLLTDAGQRCLPGLREGFNCLAEAVGQLESADHTGMLTVSVTPAFAAKWLVPRLDNFTRAHPGISVHLLATREVVDLEGGAANIAVRYGDGQYAPLTAVQMFEEEVVPVCSPALVRGAVPLRQPADLAKHVLLHDETLALDPAAPTWPTWLTAANVQGIDENAGIHFSGAELAIQAAIDGAGVLLARRSLVAADLAAGRLVIFWPLPLPADLTYYLVYWKRELKRATVAAFQSWLLAEARRGTPP